MHDGSDRKLVEKGLVMGVEGSVALAKQARTAEGRHLLLRPKKSRQRVLLERKNGLVILDAKKAQAVQPTSKNIENGDKIGG